MSAGYTSMSGRLYVWRARHQGHDVERQVLHAIDDDALYWPPMPEITLRCLDCGDSLLIALS